MINTKHIFHTQSNVFFKPNSSVVYITTKKKKYILQTYIIIMSLYLIINKFINYGAQSSILSRTGLTVSFFSSFFQFS